MIWRCSYSYDVRPRMEHPLKLFRVFRYSTKGTFALIWVDRKEKHLQLQNTLPKSSCLQADPDFFWEGRNSDSIPADQGDQC